MRSNSCGLSWSTPMITTRNVELDLPPTTWITQFIIRVAEQSGTNCQIKLSFLFLTHKGIWCLNSTVSLWIINYDLYVKTLTESIADRKHSATLGRAISGKSADWLEFRPYRPMLYASRWRVYSSWNVETNLKQII